MSIVNQNDINPSQSEDPSIISLKNLIDKIPHALSRNVRRASSPTQVNQYSTKELRLNQLKAKQLTVFIILIRITTVSPVIISRIFLRSSSEINIVIGIYEIKVS